MLSLRRDMELALGLGLTQDEKWFPLNKTVFRWVIAGVIIISVLFFLIFRRGKFRQGGALAKDVTLRWRVGHKAVIVSVFFLAMALIFLEEGIGKIPIGRPRSSGKAAVLKETQAYRVPDDKGAVNARFGEGQPVTVSERSPDWCSAESPDGRSGWVKMEAVIFY